MIGFVLDYVFSLFIAKKINNGALGYILAFFAAFLSALISSSFAIFFLADDSAHPRGAAGLIAISTGSSFVYHLPLCLVLTFWLRRKKPKPKDRALSNEQ